MKPALMLLVLCALLSSPMAEKQGIFVSLPLLAKGPLAQARKPACPSPATTTSLARACAWALACSIYNREPGKAAVVGGSVVTLALALALALVTASLTGLAAYNHSVDANPAYKPPEGKSFDVVGSEVRDLRNLLNARYTTAAVLGGLTATAWLLGALDAHLSGVDVDSLDDALARN
jgi:hypothetical protein